MLVILVDIGVLRSQLGLPDADGGAHTTHTEPINNVEPDNTIRWTSDNEDLFTSKKGRFCFQATSASNSFQPVDKLACVSAFKIIMNTWWNLFMMVGMPITLISGNINFFVCILKIRLPKFYRCFGLDPWKKVCRPWTFPFTLTLSPNK